ncbi:inactive subunit of chloroplast ClpP complex [Haematococcus lacustris]
MASQLVNAGSRVLSSLGASTRSGAPAIVVPRRRLHRRTTDLSTAGIRRSPVITPDVVVGKGDDQTSIDLFNYLLRQRIIFLTGYVNDKVATQIVGSLMALDTMDQEEDIRMYINSTGGQPYSIFGVLDAMKAVKPDIQTLGLGACYSYASLILAAGTPGKRFSMKNTRIMMTQPMGGSQGDIYQIKRTVEELNAIYQLSARYYMEFTGMDQDEVEENTNRDFFMTPEIAVQQGLIDGVIGDEEDLYAPPAVTKQLRDMGLNDDLTPNLVKWYR